MEINEKALLNRLPEILLNSLNAWLAMLFYTFVAFSGLFLFMLLDEAMSVGEEEFFQVCHLFA